MIFFFVWVNEFHTGLLAATLNISSTEVWWCFKSEKAEEPVGCRVLKLSNVLDHYFVNVSL